MMGVWERVRKALLPVGYKTNNWSWFGSHFPVGNCGVIGESFPGAWQKNVEIKTDTCLTFSAVYACITLIAGDIGKLHLRLVEKDRDGIWQETERAAFSPVLRKPNRYQTRIQFIEQWITSKLIHGNTYVLKQRDNRGIVTAMYVLDPCRVQLLINDETGDVFYRLYRDDLVGVEKEQGIVVPASEIIHDVMKPLGHPLIGVSPLVAACLAAAQGLEIQKNSTKFFANGSRPGGILTAPGSISNESAERMKEYWETNFSGDNAGKVAVLGDGLKYESMVMTATDAQMLELLRWTAENVAMCFHVPPYKIGVGALPTYNNAAILNQIYYADCLQTLIEGMEILLDEGLGLVKPGERQTMGVEFDLDDLIRMDAATQMDVLEKSKGKLTVNEQRKRLNQKPVEGGDTVYLQEQDHSLEWLAKRDAQPLPDPNATPAPSPQNDNDEAEARAALVEIYKGLR